MRTSHREDHITGVSYRVLGSVRAWRDGHELDLGSPQQRLTLAVLLLAEGRSLAVEEIASALWGQDAPRAARGTVRTYVHRLRRVLDSPDGTPAVRLSGNGYQLPVTGGELDLLRFRAARREAFQARERGDFRTAADVLTATLAEVSDVPLADLTGEWVGVERPRLQVMLIDATEDLAEVLLELGEDNPELLNWLVVLAGADPLRERLHVLLMTMLYRNGRQAEALAAYERSRAALRDGLGVDPGPALRETYQRVLRADPSLLAPARPSAPPPAPRPATSLPPETPGFVGREAEFAALDERLRGIRPPVAVVVHGMAGVGKSAFAVRTAHRLARHYPDGQLYVNLRGFEDTDVVLDPAEALRGLLDALGADPLHRPDRLGALTALYRSALAGRRCLLVLDNARDTGQVLPLLPGPGCLVLVTSRLALPGLVAGTGAHTVGLDLLTDAEAAEFVRGRLGAARVAAAPEAVARLVRVCARLPLALAVVCARAAGTPELPLADVADELEAAHGLDGFACPDGKGDVRAVLSWSYRALAPPAARLFRFLSLVPSAVTDTQVAAALSGQPPLRVLTQLRELANAHLLTEDEPGRFRWHDLVRAYANELREQVDPMPERMAAWRRVVGHYLGMARAAASVLDNHTGDQPEAEDGPPVTAPATYADALDWFTREHSALLTVLEHATGTGCLRQAWQLVWALRHYLDWAGHWAELATAARTALRAAHSEHDPVGEAYGLRVLARVDAHRGDLATAHAALARAVAGYERLGDRRAVAFTLRQWAGVSQLAGDHATAAARAAQALALFRELDHRPGVAGALVALSTNLKGLGEFEQALAAAREALTLLPETPSYELMMATYATASAYRELGRHEEAARTHERELTLLRELGAGLATGRSLLYRLVTATLLSIATAWEAAGDQPRASLALREAMDRLRVELRDPRLFAGRYDPADERLAEAVAVLSAALDRSDPAGWHDRAREALARTVALLEEVGISDYLHN